VQHGVVLDVRGDDVLPSVQLGLRLRRARMARLSLSLPQLVKMISLARQFSTARSGHARRPVRGARGDDAVHARRVAPQFEPVRSHGLEDARSTGVVAALSR